MRKFIAVVWATLVCLMITSYSVTAQNMTFETPSKSAGFDVSSGDETGETLNILGKDYTVLETSKGSAYIVLNNGSKDYPLWVGTATKESHEGQPVRQSKGGTYFIFKKGKSGMPYCKYLKAK